MKTILAGYLPRVVSASILLLLLVCLVPWIPQMPTSGLDPSWIQALNQATSQQLNFGSELVFTFGPYHSLYAQVYHPDTFTLTLVGSLLLTLAYWRMLALLWGSSPVAMATLGILLASMTRFSDAALLFYPRDAALLFYPLLVALWGERLSRNSLPYTAPVWNWALTVAPLGLLALIKGTLLVVAVAIAVLWAVHFLLQRQLLLALTTLVAPLLTALVAWPIAGQPLTALTGFVQSTLEMSAGYSEAMSVTGPNWQIAIYLSGAALFLALLLIPRPSLALTSSVLLYLFIAFKQGFVRHDGHALIAGLALALIGLVVFWQQRPRTRYLLLAAALIATTIGYRQIQPEVSSQLASVVGRLTQVFRLASRPDPVQRYEQALSRIARKDPLPLLPGTVDLYSYNQSTLIASGNRYNPRPVFQSYSAYTPRLAEINRQHLLGPQRPDYLFFRVETIDSRLPSLDDGPSWPAIFTNYRPVEWANGYLVLQSKHEKPVEPVLEELTRSRHRLGDRVELPEMGAAPVFMRIDIRPNLAGRLINLAFKTSKLLIRLELVSGEVREFRVNAGQMASGFVVSPLVSSTPDFALLMAGQSPQNKQVRAFSLHTSSPGRRLWQNGYEISLLQVKFDTRPLPFNFAEFMPRRSSPLATTRLVLMPGCLANLDQINEQNRAPQIVSGSIDLAGWMVRSVRPPLLPAKPVGLLIAADGRVSQFTLRTSSRPDVSAYLQHPSLENSGISANAIIDHLPSGRYTLALGDAQAEPIEVCNGQISFEVVTKP